MTQHTITLALALVFSTTISLSGCNRTSNLTEQEHIQRAKDFEDKGQLKGSIVELKSAIQKFPDSPQARLLLGQIYLKTGMGAEAEKELKRAEELGVNHESIKPLLGEALLNMREYQRVLDEIQPGAQTSQANLARIIQLRADALLKLGKLGEACNLFQQSLDADRNNPPTYWGLSQCAVAERDMIKAKTLLDSALKIRDRQAKTWIFIGDLAQLNGNPGDALAAYTNALKLEPDNREALQSKATLEIVSGQLEAARIDLERIHALAPKSLGANYLKALLKFKEKDFSEARVAMQQALTIAPDYLPGLLLSGSIEYALGNLQIAESHTRKVLQIAPRNGKALQLLATIQLRQGRVEDAEKTIAPINLGATKDAGIYTVAGEIAMAKNEFSKASEYFQAAAELSPNSSTIRSELGLARLSQGDPRAMQDLQAAAAMEGAGIRVDVIIILNQLRQKQFDAVLPSIANLEKKLPSSPLPWLYRGTAYLGKNDTTKAKASFIQALKLDPKFYPAAAGLAKLDLKDGQTRSARKRYEDILEVEPKNLQAMLALADLSLREKDESGYLDWLEKAAKVHPLALLPRELLVNHYLAKKDHNKAISLANEIANTHPRDLNALILLGRTQLMVGDTKNAKATFSKLAQRDNQSPEALVQLANAQFADKDLVGAKGSLHKALQLKPDHLQSLDALLRLELREKNTEQALLIARQIQTKHPQLPLGFDREGDIRLTSKQIPQAISSYEMALSKGAGAEGFVKLFRARIIAGDVRTAELSLVNWLNLHPKDFTVRAYAAEYFLVRNRNREAITQYTELLQHDPNNIVFLNDLAVLFQREKDSRAMSIAELALKLAPDNPVIQDTAGWIMVEQGQVQRGLKLLQKALIRMPKSATVRYHHAFAMAQTGDRANARKQIEKLLKETRDFPESTAAEALLRSL